MNARYGIIYASWIASAMLSALSARADLIAYDGFWDVEGGTVYNSQLHNTDTGYGWTGKWVVTAESNLKYSNVVPVSDGYSYPGLETAGGRCKWNGSGNGRRHYAKRSFAVPDGCADGTTLWISFLHYKGDTGRDNAFYLYDGTNSPVRCLAPANGTKKWSFQVGDQTVATQVSCDKKINLVLLRIDFKAGNDDVYMWAGTALDLSAEPSVDTAAASLIGAADFTVDALEARGGQYTTDYWDEFRIGETFFDVTKASPPRIRPQAATDVGATSATLNATLEAGGFSNASIYVYWGETDGGNDPLAWEFSAKICDATDNGMVSTNIAVAANTAYVCRFYAVNDYGESWSPDVQSFSTKSISIETLDSDGDETIDNTLAFRVSRSADSVGSPLSVNVGLSGTAVNGEDYEAIDNPLTVEIGAEDTYVDIVVTPKQDIVVESDETVVATLLPGSYVIGVSSVASATLHDVVIPGAPTNIWIGSGSASLDANWSLGHAPTSEETVLLDGYSRADMTWDASASPTVAEWLQLGHYTGTVTVDTRYEGAFTELSVTGDVTVNGGAMTHVAHANNTTRQYCLRLDIGGNLAVGPGGAIHADGKGFYATRGPGLAKEQNGGAYGGTGGVYNTTPTGTNTYGSVLLPVDPGSGGARNASAGGAVLVDVAGSTFLDGVLRANGGSGGVGSGGSVLLRTATLAGDGLVSANGGSGDSDSAGGGGRVAVYVGDGTGIGNVSLVAEGGKSSRDNSNRRGGAGTVYLQTAADSAGGGTVRIDSPSDLALSKYAFTDLPAAWSGTYGNYDYTYAENLSKTTWVIGNSKLQLQGDVSLWSLSLSDTATLVLNGHTLQLSEMSIAGTRIHDGVYTSDDLDHVTGEGTIEIRDRSCTILLLL